MDLVFDCMDKPGWSQENSSIIQLYFGKGVPTIPRDDNFIKNMVAGWLGVYYGIHWYTDPKRSTPHEQRVLRQDHVDQGLGLITYMWDHVGVAKNGKEF